MRIVIGILLMPLLSMSQQFRPAEISRWKKEAANVTIIRDNWGIPHVYGKSDADAVFGLLYAQCEDDFPRVEMNYLEKMGRLAEVQGESMIYNDLLIRLVIDSADAKRDYQNSPAWFKKLLDAFADGVNYFLYKNPSVKPALLRRFEPWFPLLWTDGSIGSINTADVTEKELENFYSGKEITQAEQIQKEKELTGSNGFAFSPTVTASHHAILYINPHVTLYFRPEVHMHSEEGLNAYGAVTWGQFFVYQGFNEHCGWMHTSSNVDIADLYSEKISKKNNHWVYEYNHLQRPLIEKRINIIYRTADGMKTKSINALFTHHGPLMTKRNEQWLALKANNRSLNGLVQCWQRTKTTSFASFKKNLSLVSNTSNNTVYADAEGNIAYWHGNFVPIRDTSFDWGKPVDGSNSITEWKGLHTIDQIVHVYNPSNGWIQNCNSTPFSVAGDQSPKKQDYPAYMAPDGENFRGVNAAMVLGSQNGYTLEKVIAAGYDTYLSAFDPLIPALVGAFEKQEHSGDSSMGDLKSVIAILRDWDRRVDEKSIATTIAIEWAQRLNSIIQRVYIDENEIDQVESTKRFAAGADPATLLKPLQETVADLQKRFGTWQVAWGDINRFQRVKAAIKPYYSDSLPSLPIKFASSVWGMLPSYNSRTFNGTNKRYGVNGNSFICAVEFGEKVVAKSLLAGGETGDAGSSHFNDQARMYTRGIFKDVLFYKEDVLKHAERSYHPGDKN